MTVQVEDWLVYNGEKYELLGDSSRQLPMIQQYGMNPIEMHTACHRGYFAEYAIVDAHLYLTHLVIRETTNHYPEIGGVKPTPYHSESREYANLSVPMLINGALVIGKDVPTGCFWRDMHRHPYDYLCVLRLTLHEGIAVSATDISQEAAVIRQEVSAILQERFERQSQLLDDYRMKELIQLGKRSLSLTYGSNEDGN